MKHSETLGEIATALAAAHAEMPVIPKTAQGHGYKYADHAIILEKVRPVLKKHGLSVVQSGGGEGEPVETMLLHKSGEWIRCQLNMPVVDENKRMNGAQAVGATITYGRRYGIAAALNLSVDDDTDAHQQPAKSKAQKSGGEPSARELDNRMKAAAGKMKDERVAYWREQYASGKWQHADLVREMESEVSEFKDQPPFEADKPDDGEIKSAAKEIRALREDDAIAAAVFDGEVVDEQKEIF